jgi:CHASE3 domain sensor protein
MKIRSLLDRKVQLAFGAGIAILLVVGAFSYRSMVVSTESDQWVRHTHRVLENLQAVNLALVSIESSSRGFVLSGEESYLEPFRAGLLRAKQLKAIIRELTLDNPEQQRQLSALEGLVAQKIQHVESTVGLRRAQGFEAASDAVRTGRGEQIMDEFQAVLHQMEGEELQLLEQRNADAKRHLDESKAVLIVGILLGLLITTAAGWSVQRDGSRRKMAEMHLLQKVEEFNRSNEELEQFASVASHDLEHARMVASYRSFSPDGTRES